MNRRRTATVIGLILILVAINWSRPTRYEGEAALLSHPPGIWVQLGDGFVDAGMVRQFNDDSRLLDVISLTQDSDALLSIRKGEAEVRLEAGMRIDLKQQGTDLQQIYYSWMPAGQRIGLGIKLHPDRMTESDWRFLPGIGPKLAARIALNRQNNGEFGSFEALRRIKGVGKKKMEAWRKYF